MRRLPRCVCVLSGVFSLALVSAGSAQPVLTDKKAEADKSAMGGYVRVQRDDKNVPTALETATVRFVSDKREGVVVDLVAAVHVGDKAYYQALNKQFNGYDVVLYELVAPPGTRVPKGGKRDFGNPLSLVQHAMKGVLDLESQTERIDYTKPNFVHADLSLEGMREKMRERGEDGITLALNFVADLLRQSNRQSKEAGNKLKDVVDKDKEAINKAKALADIDFLALLNDPDAPLKVKRVMAEQLADPDVVGSGFGQAISNILITDRNQAALKVLETELAKGRKKIAIFYGAAHMPDFEERLRKEFGMRRQGEKWLTAWNLED